MNYFKFTNDKLSNADVRELVTSSSCARVVVGNDSASGIFENKNVSSLLWRSFEQKALKTLTDLCHGMRNQWQSVENIAIYHRLGPVPLKEAAVIIAVSSSYSEDATTATAWCIEQLKNLVPIWEKEMYEEDSTEWKENKDSLHSRPKPKRRRINLEQKVEIPYIPRHFQKIHATKAELHRRIEAFQKMKRNEVDVKNIAEFCTVDRSSEFKCARIDSTMKKRTDSKGHVQVDRVLNTYYDRDQFNSEYLTKYIPPNGVEERLQNLESQLSLEIPFQMNIYKRLELVEDRMLLTESISPEYAKFWVKGNTIYPKPIEKKKFSIEEIDALIKDLENQVD
ncbi:hypothetical protein WA026_007159 [Henosepilachna vigintioctopunctata]|uniref:Molybdopterin synthase catalytic subunit n=1 Tax=Henosepilachna vigintioctopunctata TaxID=420089 RepID=A0AAW1V270_9CUCU